MTVAVLERRARHRVPESELEARRRSATTLITNLLRCVLWLMGNGIHVIGFDGSRRGDSDRVTVRVTASPYLHILFGVDGCYWRRRRQEGVLTIYTWCAERFDCRIEWEDVQCRAS